MEGFISFYVWEVSPCVNGQFNEVNFDMTFKSKGILTVICINLYSFKIWDEMGRF